MWLSNASDMILEHLQLLLVLFDEHLIFPGVFTSQSEAALITNSLLFELHFLHDIQYVLTFLGHFRLLVVCFVQQFHY